MFRISRALAMCVLGSLWLSAGTAYAGGPYGATLAELKARIVSGDIPGIHSVAVIADGKTIVEWYFQGVDATIGPTGPVALGQVVFGPDTLHDVRSVTKSVVSMLFGIAYASGAIKDLDAPVLDYFPEYADLRSPERLKIRVRDLLTMTSGLHWDQNTYPFTDVRNSEIAMEVADDPYRYVLSQTIDAPRGTRFNYSSGDVALVAAIVTRVTKTPIETYAQQKLFGPLGVVHFEWSKNNGIPRAASGLRLTTLDMGKLGVLMLDGGRWQGSQIVPESWVKASTSPHVDVEPDPVCGTKYGYLWWIGASCGSEPQSPWYAGFGLGGQRIWVVPSRRLVVVSTAGLYSDPKQGDASAAAVLTGVLGELAQ